ncbi:UNVERIFIED_CONTAM: hypothetical protein GTU68_012501 [Idotea baltica]|nr:hypothetical protein [Idotea baltica]
MRSRYSAYALQQIPYLVETVTQDKRADHQPASLQGWANAVTFKRLDILHTEAGQEGDSTGTVDFQAWYLEKGRLECLREKSLFFREAGRWKYSHGTHAKAQIGRNDTCPCGSGRKYKKCHG